MATKFSPCKGSYVLNQFPSNVMFGMNGFHVSASGAIQGHHGPLVLWSIGQNSHVRASDLENEQLFPLHHQILSERRLTNQSTKNKLFLKIDSVAGLQSQLWNILSLKRFFYIFFFCLSGKFEWVSGKNLLSLLV